MEDQLTDRQEELLDLLISGVPWRQALEEVGYSSHTKRSSILKSSKFRAELASRLEGQLALNGPAAVSAMEDALNNSTAPGMGIKLKAAGEFLDRMGVGRTEKKEVVPSNVVFVLPEKKS